MVTRAPDAGRRYFSIPAREIAHVDDAESGSS